MRKILLVLVSVLAFGGFLFAEDETPSVTQTATATVTPTATITKTATVTPTATPIANVLQASKTFGDIVDIKNITSNTRVASTSGTILAIISADDGNTSDARSIVFWDNAGNTIFSHGYPIGEQVPDDVFDALTFGDSEPTIYAGLAYTGGLTARTSVKIKVIIK